MVQPRGPNLEGVGPLLEETLQRGGPARAGEEQPQVVVVAPGLQAAQALAQRRVDLFEQGQEFLVLLAVELRAGVEQPLLHRPMRPITAPRSPC